jgi:Na+/alanine symporter
MAKRILVGVGEGGMGVAVAVSSAVGVGSGVWVWVAAAVGVEMSVTTLGEQAHNDKTKNRSLSFFIRVGSSDTPYKNAFL